MCLCVSAYVECIFVWSLFPELVINERTEEAGEKIERKNIVHIQNW